MRFPDQDAIVVIAAAAAKDVVKESPNRPLRSAVIEAALGADGTRNVAAV